MKDVIIAAVVTAVAYLVNHNEDQIRALGIEHGKFINDNVSDKLPAGQKIEDAFQKASGIYLDGLNEGLDIND